MPDASAGISSLSAWLDSVLGSPDPLFSFSAEKYDALLEHEIESRFAVSNGFLGIRGSMELPGRASLPRTYVAGFFDKLRTSASVAALIPGPNWLLQINVEGQVQPLTPETATRYGRRLDMLRGLLLSEWEFALPGGGSLHLRGLRLASQSERGLALQALELSADHSLELQLRASVQSATPDLLLERSQPPLAYWRTAASGRQLVTLMEESLAGPQTRNSARHAADGRSASGTIRLLRGQPVVFTRTAAFTPVAADAETPLETMRDVSSQGVPSLLQAHLDAWQQHWQASDIVVEGDEEAQQALRFALYHIISAGNPESETTSIGARALTGDGYLGHVFWDTETFVLPVLMHTWPEAARAALMYRYRTLPAARAKAARHGYRGALYAWESADTGEEVTPPVVVRPDGTVLPILNGLQEHHISADVAFAVWQYWKVTEDEGFFRDAGAEIMLETARFWATRAVLEPDGHHHIRGVIGPDEYHENVDDNAYTNEMARWNLLRGAETADLLRDRWPERWLKLHEALDLTALEVESWRTQAGAIVRRQDPETGLYEQFEGFFDLRQERLDVHESRMSIMELVLGTERVRQSQIVKQADVVMMLALLWECFTPREREVNFRHYEPLCAHDSSLSPGVHALVAARLGDVDLAYRYFTRAKDVDLANAMGNTAGGVHIGALGGMWQAVMHGFAGMSLCEDGLSFEPHLPRHWDSLAFPLSWRGRRVRLRIQSEPLTVDATLEYGEPMVVRAWGAAQELRSGETRTWSLED